MAAPEWRIYYGDGSTFSSGDGPPQEAPALNVQAIVRVDTDPNGVGRYVLQGFDYYWLTECDGWYGGDLFGLFDYLAGPGWKRVLFGRSIPGPEFRAAVSAAAHDPEFLPLARPGA